jgi:hypothetical protein
VQFIGTLPIGKMTAGCPESTLLDRALQSAEVCRLAWIELRIFPIIVSCAWASGDSGFMPIRCALGIKWCRARRSGDMTFNLDDALAVAVSMSTATSHMSTATSHMSTATSLCLQQPVYVYSNQSRIQITMKITPMKPVIQRPVCNACCTISFVFS